MEMNREPADGGRLVAAMCLQSAVGSDTVRLRVAPAREPVGTLPPVMSVTCILTASCQPPCPAAFTLDSAGKPFPLDMRGELDDTASFRRWAIRGRWKVLGTGLAPVCMLCGEVHWRAAVRLALGVVAAPAVSTGHSATPAAPRSGGMWSSRCPSAAP